MNTLEKARNAVMWHLYTHGKRATVEELLALKGFDRNTLTGAINTLSKKKELKLWYNAETVRMNRW